MEPLVIVLVILGFFVVVFALKGIVVVPQAAVIVVERLGRFHRRADSGLNIIWPLVDGGRAIQVRVAATDPSGERILIDRIVLRIDLREQVLDIPPQPVITRDNVTMSINVVIYYQITDPVRAVYEIVNLPYAIEMLTRTTLRNVVGEMDLDQTLVSREIINGRLRTVLDETTDNWGVKVTRVELLDIAPPHDILTAMEKQMRAERDRRAVVLEAEGKKASTILVAEGERQAAIARAEGDRQATILRAEGQAQARLTVANAEAQALNLIRGGLPESSPANYLIALKYLEMLPTVAAGQATKIFLPLEASAILGSLAGIRELFAGVSPGSASSPPPAEGGAPKP